MKAFPLRTRALPALRWSLIGLGSIGLVGALWTAWIVLRLPDVGGLRENPPGATAFMRQYLRERSRRGLDSTLEWTWVSQEAISPHLKRAVLVSEDINFFSHDGFDRGEIQSALRKAWEQKSLPRGASTLTQQLARNLYLSPTRTPWRKLQEALLTRRLERELSKRRILEIYLNVVEFGPGLYGAEAASRYYFGIGAVDLSERQAAELAAVLPRPKSWYPGRDSRGYREAVGRILRRMAKAQFLWRLISGAQLPKDGVGSPGTSSRGVLTPSRLTHRETPAGSSRPLGDHPRRRCATVQSTCGVRATGESGARALPLRRWRC